MDWVFKGYFSHTVIETQTVQRPHVTNTELERCQLPTVMIRTGKEAVSVSLLKSGTAHQRPVYTSKRSRFTVKWCSSAQHSQNLLCRTNAATLTHWVL